MSEPRGAAVNGSAMRQVAQGFDRLRDLVRELDDNKWTRRVLVVVAVIAFFVMVRTFHHLDAYAYYWSYARRTDLYTEGMVGYLYAPTFLQVLTPITWLPFEAFYAIWLAMLMGVALFMTGPTIGILLCILLAAPSGLTPEADWLPRHALESGNIYLFLGFAALIGSRWPASWAFIVLTKVSPAVGVLWFAVRREWRKLAIAIGFTAAVSAVSFALAPNAWIEWITLLASNTGRAEPDFAVHFLPMWPRIALAAALVIVGAVKTWRWTLPLAALLAMPYIGTSAMVVLIALIPAFRRVEWLEPNGPSIRDIPGALRRLPSRYI